MTSMRHYMSILQEAASLRLFHASPATIDRFAPLSHFGSREAALARAANAKYSGQPMHLYEVNFVGNNPLRIRDLNANKGAVHSWSKIVDMLHYTVRKISAVERSSIFKAGGGLEDAAPLH